MIARVGRRLPERRNCETDGGRLAQISPTRYAQRLVPESCQGHRETLTTPSRGWLEDHLHRTFDPHSDSHPTQKAVCNLTTDGMLERGAHDGIRCMELPMLRMSRTRKSHRLTNVAGRSARLQEVKKPSLYKFDACQGTVGRFLACCPRMNNPHKLESGASETYMHRNSQEH